MEFRAAEVKVIPLEAVDEKLALTMELAFPPGKNDPKLNVSLNMAFNPPWIPPKNPVKVVTPATVPDDTSVTFCTGAVSIAANDKVDTAEKATAANTRLIFMIISIKEVGRKFRLKTATGLIGPGISNLSHVIQPFFKSKNLCDKSPIFNNCSQFIEDSS
ncbi:hypothetical protein GCM10022212_12820 [Actimicrobium antarcticum]|uniref:Uncharacterized protein n=1 Tax=Actimicrobium antarcticum TaxID=1051899 RepID=A0ABP7SZB6_9BURK